MWVLTASMVTFLGAAGYLLFVRDEPVTAALMLVPALGMGIAGAYELLRGRVK